MADELEFIEQGLQRSQIDEFFAEELARAGYGGMDLAPTPMGMQIVLKAEKPGMVIGKGGKNIRKITTQLEERFDLEDPQIDVQEVDEPDLNAQIVADRLANALERGWYFRKAGHTTIDRIMESGALGAEIVLSGKVTGNRGRVEKFNRGYIKHNGEPAEEIVDHGKGVAVMKLGTIGVNVKIIPPNAELPDDFEIQEDADIEDLVVDEAEAGEDLEELLEGEGDEVAAEDDEAADVEDAAESAEFDDEEVIEEAIEADDEVEEELDELADEVEGEDDEFSDVDEEAAETAEDLLDEMDDEEGGEE
ncbi:30S ribosomal protein S3 [Halobacterium jilantaiense]|uniref:Small ribosomal subunit protein uS3 n=1 Tax=Halobacterium jilantaiense TaxID=355548 RepID=A0A1I0QAQ1_9EURY|nr:30S ribosomal protein S3 [Halobacterium jilantaiense]SEW24117.1 SSU ribosomal protein S3P [Halobacterium jilantaiense]